MYNPFYASDFLRSYGDPLLVKYIDLDHLQEAPTTHLSGELKEVIMDASLTTRLLGSHFPSEVLFHLEHKSRPSRTVVLQLLTEVALSLHFRWFLNKKIESGTFAVPIPLMIVVYNGVEDWKGEILFQDLFPKLPAELRSFVPQFRVFLIHLRRFQYGNLPGRPETRAIAESLMRATDGTFIEHLSDVFRHVAESGLDERRRLDLTRCVASYCTWGAQATSEQIIDAITTVFKKQECLTMIEMIKDKYILEGFEMGKAQGEARGEARGETRGKINSILRLLRLRFNRVSITIEEELNARTDLIALESLFDLAAQCNSLDEFADAL